MKNNTTTKKVWQKPDVSDLDVNTTAGGDNPGYVESTSGTAS